MSPVRPRSGWASDKGVRTDGRGYVLAGPDLLEGIALAHLRLEEIAAA